MQKSKTQDPKIQMSEISWASEQLRTYVAPPTVSGGVKGRIGRAARALGWSYERAKSVWYADERVALRPRELRQIEQYTGLQYGRKELGELDAAIARANTLLMGQDEDFVSAFIDALGTFASALDRARTKGGERK